MLHFLFIFTLGLAAGIALTVVVILNNKAKAKDILGL